mgnify:CR=1 FL=1
MFLDSHFNMSLRTSGGGSHRGSGNNGKQGLSSNTGAGKQQQQQKASHLMRSLLRPTPLVIALLAVLGLAALFTHRLLPSVSTSPLVVPLSPRTQTTQASNNKNTNTNPPDVVKSTKNADSDASDATGDTKRKTAPDNTVKKAAKTPVSRAEMLKDMPDDLFPAKTRKFKTLTPADPRLATLARHREADWVPLDASRTYPHDPAAFTQGLVVHNGQLVESTGMYKVSDVRVVELESGKVLRKVDIPAEHFGEGLTVVPEVKPPQGSSGGGGDSGSGDEWFMLTWRESVVHAFDSQWRFKQDRALSIDTEGWGLCLDPRTRSDYKPYYNSNNESDDLHAAPVRHHSNPTRNTGLADSSDISDREHDDRERQQSQYDRGLLVLSDGSAVLRWHDPATMREVRRVTVRKWEPTVATHIAASVPGTRTGAGTGAEAGESTVSAADKGEWVPVKLLNELEWVNGYVWANVWFSTKIAVIEPDSGIVVAWLDANELTMKTLQDMVKQGGKRARDAEQATLNGIAFDEKRNVVLVTGKLWHKMYEIALPIPGLDEAISKVRTAMQMD